MNQEVKNQFENYKKNPDGSLFIGEHGYPEYDYDKDPIVSVGDTPKTKKHKVITIRTYMGNTSDFEEKEYPKLNSLLEEGYLVRDVITVEPKQSEKPNYYAMTFILEKL